MQNIQETFHPTVKALGAHEDTAYFQVRTGLMQDGTARSICGGDILLTEEIPSADWRTEIDKGEGVYILQAPYGAYIYAITAFIPGRIFPTVRGGYYSPKANEKDFVITLPPQIFKLYKVRKAQRSCKISRKKAGHQGASRLNMPIYAEASY